MHNLSSAAISSKEGKPMQADSCWCHLAVTLALLATEWTQRENVSIFLCHWAHRTDRKAGILPPYPSTAPAEIRVCSSWSSTTVTLCWKSLKRKEKRTLFSFKVSKILLLSSRPCECRENLLLARQENLETPDVILDTTILWTLPPVKLPLRDKCLGSSLRLYLSGHR